MQRHQYLAPETASQESASEIPASACSRELPRYHSSIASSSSRLNALYNTCTYLPVPVRLLCYPRRYPPHPGDAAAAAHNAPPSSTQQRELHVIPQRRAPQRDAREDTKSGTGTSFFFPFFFLFPSTTTANIYIQALIYASSFSLSSLQKKILCVRVTRSRPVAADEA